MNSTGGKAVRTLLVDDHTIVRESIAKLLSQEKWLEICGEAGGASQALGHLRKTPTDLMITDLSLQDGDGLELIRDAVKLQPNLTVVVLSMHDEMIFIERAIRAGARAYVTKRESPAFLIQAVQAALKGEIYVNKELSSRIMKRLLGKDEAGEASPLDSLSDRELQVFRLIGQGLSTKEIAKHLHLSAKTVETYQANIKAKLKLSSGREVFLMAVRESVNWEPKPGSSTTQPE